MLPWKDSFGSWSAQVGFRLDALGLVTILGDKEMDASVGRLVPSRYVEFLPLIGAFAIAGDSFTEKKAGFTLYNVSKGFRTTELAGWLSRWLKAQDFHQVHSIVVWDIDDKPPPPLRHVVVSVPVSILFNGMLIAMSILSGDWWGLANAMAMVVSIAVRCFLLAQNRAGIDRKVKDLKAENAQRKSQKIQSASASGSRSQSSFNLSLPRNGLKASATDEPPRSAHDFNGAKVIVVMDDSKVITMDVPEFLIAPVLAGNPEVPNPLWYKFVRWVGWAGFVVHVISLGMASLPTQIYTVVLLVVPTVLTAFKFGCDDSTLWSSLKMRLQGKNSQARAGEPGPSCCWIGQTLKATCSEYSEEYEPEKLKQMLERSSTGVLRTETPDDIETGQIKGVVKRSDRRQDLYVWLGLTEEEENSMKKWDLLPHNVPANQSWWNEYSIKKQHLTACPAKAEGAE